MWDVLGTLAMLAAVAVLLWLANRAGIKVLPCG